MRTGLTFRELIVDHAVQNVRARLQPENFVGKIDRAGLRRRECGYIDLHYAPSLSAPAASTGAASAATAPPARRNAPGVGTPSGNLPFTASRTRTQPPLEPGTAPLTMIRPRSTSVRTTSRFWVVMRSAPMCPAIFLPLNTLPGSCR